jgi:hypothetical protein
VSARHGRRRIRRGGLAVDVVRSVHSALQTPRKRITP